MFFAEKNLSTWPTWLLSRKTRAQIESFYQGSFKWKHGETIPRSDSLERLAKVFGVPLEWFFSDKPASDSVPLDILEAVKDPRMQTLIRAMWPIIKNMKE